MPGLVGIVSKDKIDDKLLNRMIKSLCRENQYKIDKYSNSHFGIGRVHLGIFNPDSQPTFNKNKLLCIFMDGKIYDYDDELEDLNKKGYLFKKKNDSEFCLHLYEEYGLEFVNKLNGEFVIIIHDLKEKKTIIVNDRFGLRPFNYSINNGNLLFSPEIKAILEDKTLKKELNDKAIIELFAFGFILGSKTLIKNIKILPPASIAIFQHGKLNIRQYWNIPNNPNYTKSDDEFADELVKVFKHAIEVRMTDKPRYAISLSGGFDSRCISVAIPKNLIKNVTAFIHGPEECNDIKLAIQVANQARLNYKVIPINPNMVIDRSEEGVILSDGSVYLGFNFLPKFNRKIKEDKKDIIFWGFRPDNVLTSKYLTKEIINIRNEKELKELLLNKWRFFTDSELNNLLKEKYQPRVKDYPKLSFLKEFTKIKNDSLINRNDSFVETNYMRRAMYPAQFIARTNIEIINPFYDVNFVDLALTIPPKKRLNYRIYRKFLKKLSSEMIKIPYNQTMLRPSAPMLLWKFGRIIYRGKRVSSRKLFQWSKGRIALKDKQSYDNWDELFRVDEEWINFFKDLLLKKDTKLKKYFNQEFIKDLFQVHKEGKANKSHHILYLATFEIFLREFMDK